MAESCRGKYRRGAYKLHPKIAKCFGPDYRRDAFDEYISDNPDFIQALFQLAGKTQRKIQFFKWTRAGAERYQVGVTSKRTSDIFCLNESFHHLGAHMITESEDTFHGNLNDKYFNLIPTPDLLIHVDADSNICLDRQQGRDRNVSAIDTTVVDHSDALSVQAEFRKTCVKVREKLDGETNVMEVDNSGDINGPVSEIRNKIKELYEPGEK